MGLIPNMNLQYSTDIYLESVDAFGVIIGKSVSWLK